MRTPPTKWTCVALVLGILAGIRVERWLDLSSSFSDVRVEAGFEADERTTAPAPTEIRTTVRLQATQQPEQEPPPKSLARVRPKPMRPVASPPPTKELTEAPVVPAAGPVLLHLLLQLRDMGLSFFQTFLQCFLPPKGRFARTGAHPHAVLRRASQIDQPFLD